MKAPAECLPPVLGYPVHLHEPFQLLEAISVARVDRGIGFVVASKVDCHLLPRQRLYRFKNQESNPASLINDADCFVTECFGLRPEVSNGSADFFPQTRGLVQFEFRW